MKKQSWLKVIIINFVVILLLLSIIEITIRVYSAKKHVFNINIGAMNEWHPTRGGRKLKANYKAEGISINSYGILGPEIELEQNPKGIRILTIGNSVTFAPPNRNYSRILEEKLNEYFPNNDIEVVVGAVPGYCSYAALDWYNEFLYKLKPDIAIIYLGWNDMWVYNPFYPFHFKRKSKHERSLVESLMNKLYFLRIPYYLGSRSERAKAVDLSPLTLSEEKIIDDFYPDHYVENLTTLIEKLKDQGSSVYLLSLAGLMTYTPTNDELARMHFGRGMNKKLEILMEVYNKYQDALGKVSISTETTIIDLRKLIKTTEQRYIFTDAMHINEEGAKSFGFFIANAIKPDVDEMLKNE
jgi:lysophospholipase L1-like esterase